MASQPKGWQGPLISDERGSPEPGTAVANVCSSGAPLAVVCSFERKGCGSTQGQQELVMARAHVCVRWCLVLVPSVAGLGTWQCSGRLAVQCQAGSANQLVFLNTPNPFKSHEIARKVLKSRENLVKYRLVTTLVAPSSALVTRPTLLGPPTRLPLG